MNISQFVEYWKEHKDYNLTNICKENDILLFVGKVNWGENCITEDFWVRTYVVVKTSGYAEIMIEHNLSGAKVDENVISIEDINVLKDLISNVVAQKELPVDGCDGEGSYILSYIDDRIHTTNNYCYATSTEQELLDKLGSILGINL